jgi:hypothetical protein
MHKLQSVCLWLQNNEPLVMWLEGIALVAIFGLELAEYKRQVRGRKEAESNNLQYAEYCHGSFR